jgi:GDPmannose 4,6-dehydratase
LEFQGEGIDEQATVTADPEIAPALKLGDCIVRVDPRYFRPAEVETLLGDPTHARERLGWVPEISVQQMVTEDLQSARRYALLKAHGHSIPIAREDGR